MSPTFFFAPREAYKTIDPAGREDRQEFRDDGKLKATIENYDDGDPTTGAADKDRRVEFSYTADGQVKTITAKQQSASDDQVTTFVYGTTLVDSDVALSNLLRAEILPDSDDVASPLGDGADEVYDRIEYKYNRQGERKEMKDQNGTVHAYDRDKLARLLHDRVTTLGSGVDGAVRRLSMTYMVLGLMEKVTSYDNATVGSGNVVNEIQREYNDFAQLITEYQEHGGAVNTGTCPKVQYAYSSGSANHIRPTSITYPNGRVLTIDYGTSGGVNDVLSRVESIKDGSTVLAKYAYLGLSTVVEVDYQEPDVKYTLIDLAGNNDADTGDIYSGLDRFSRVKDCRWYNYGASSDIVRIKHGHDRFGNPLWREDAVAAGQSPAVHLDELYAYDGLNQLNDMQRGDLNSSKDAIVSGTKSFAQQWTLDPLGNWPTFKEDTDGDGSWNLDQARSHNKGNEITAIDSSSTHIAHDRGGNSTKLPKTDNWSAHFDLTYNAWNSLVKVVDGANTLAEYAYDALMHRALRNSYIGGSLDHTDHFYYSSRWQVLEERVDSSTDAARQFVWGRRYVDDLILRDRDTSTPRDGTLDERRYALNDARWSVVAIIGPTAVVAERYLYSAFGVGQVLTAAFAAYPSSTNDQHYRFHGYRFEPETSTYFTRWRYYVPHLGRWNSVDPIRTFDGALRFVKNSPVRLTDPYGQLEQETVPMLSLDEAERAKGETGHISEKCGGYHWRVRWKPDPHTEQDGYIIQRVTIRQKVNKCSGGLIPFASRCRVVKAGAVSAVSYIEIWKVVGGVIYIDADQEEPSKKSDRDIFALDAPGEETFGCHNKHGVAIFVPAGKMTFPDDLKRFTVPEAGTLFAACSEGGITKLFETWEARYAKSKTEKIEKRKWNCCKKEGGAVTVTTHRISCVHLDEEGRVITPAEDLRRLDAVDSPCNWKED